MDRKSSQFATLYSRYILIAVNSSSVDSQRKRDDFLQVNYLDIETKLSGSGALSKDSRDPTAHLLSLSSNFSPMPFPVNNNNRDHAKKDGSVCAELEFWFIGGLQGRDSGKPQLSKLETEGVTHSFSLSSR